VVRIGLTKPRVRLVWVVAPELLMIDGLDMLTRPLNAGLPAHYDPLCHVYRWESQPNSIAIGAGRGWWGIPLTARVQSLTQRLGSEFREWRKRSCTAAVRIQIRTAGDCRSDRTRGRSSTGSSGRRVGRECAATGRDRVCSRVVAGRLRRGQNGGLIWTWSRALIPLSCSRMSPSSPRSAAPIAAAPRLRLTCRKSATFDATSGISSLCKHWRQPRSRRRKKRPTIAVCCPVITPRSQGCSSAVGNWLSRFSRCCPTVSSARRPTTRAPDGSRPAP
jgi:hypothetical protein